MKLSRRPLPLVAAASMVPVAAGLAGVLTATDAQAATGCRVAYTIASRWHRLRLSVRRRRERLQADIAAAGCPLTVHDPRPVQAPSPRRIR